MTYWNLRNLSSPMTSWCPFFFICLWGLITLEGETESQPTAIQESSKCHIFRLLFKGSQDPWFSQYFSAVAALRMRQYSDSIQNSLDRIVLVPFHPGQVPGSRCTKPSKVTHGRYPPRQKGGLFPYRRNSKSTEGCAFVSLLTTLVLLHLYSVELFLAELWNKEECLGSPFHCTHTMGIVFPKSCQTTLLDR